MTVMMICISILLAKIVTCRQILGQSSKIIKLHDLRFSCILLVFRLVLFAMASVLTSCSNVPCGPGRPRAAGEDLPLVVTIDSKENAMHTESNAVLLRVPNKLLFTWYQSNTAAAKYMSLVNDAILDKVILLKPENEELARKFRQ